MLFLLDNETTREKVAEKDQGRQPSNPDRVVEAGNLSVRMITGRQSRMPSDLVDYSPSLLLEESSISPIELSTAEAMIPQESSTEMPSRGFSSQLLEMGGAVCKVFAVLACIGILGGICSFLVGVAIPFGLL